MPAPALKRTKSPQPRDHSYALPTDTACLGATNGSTAGGLSRRSTSRKCFRSRLRTGRSFLSCDFNLDLHLFLHQACLNHRRCRSDIAEPSPQYRPSLFEVGTVRQNVTYPDDFSHARAGVFQGRCNVSKGLFRLILYVARNVSSAIVISVCL